MSHISWRMPNEIDEFFEAEDWNADHISDIWHVSNFFLYERGKLMWKEHWKHWYERNHWHNSSVYLLYNFFHEYLIVFPPRTFKAVI